MSLVRDADVLSIVRMEALEGDGDVEMDDGWDTITFAPR
jgi:hypothetical protein